MHERLRIRPAREDDARPVAELLYLTSPGGYILFGGSEKRGVRLIESAFRTPGTDTARDVVLVAELHGEIAGAMAVFPAEQGEERRRRFLRVALRRRPPWRWPRIVRVATQGSARAPEPPPGSLYVDALATADRFRRRGVAAALLDEAERIARERGLEAVALDTTAENSGARALYESYGFEVSEQVPGKPPIPAMVGYFKRL